MNINRLGGVMVGSSSGAINGTVGSIGILRANRGGLRLSSSRSVYVGGSNSGNVTANGSGSTIAINGGNNAVLSMNGDTIQVNGSRQGINHANLSYTGKFSRNLNGGATATSVRSVSLTAPTSTLGSFATRFQTPLTTVSTQLAGVAANSSRPCQATLLPSMRHRMRRALPCSTSTRRCFRSLGAVRLWRR